MCIEHNKQMVSRLCLRRKTPNWLMFPQVALVGFKLLTFLLISHLRMLLDNSLRSILRRWYTEGKISASERRVLVTKWVGKAWTEVGSNRDMVVRSFKNVAFLYLWTVPKMERFTLKASRNTNCQQLMKQLNLNLTGKAKLKMIKIILK